VFGGLGVAAFGVFAYFGLRGMSDASHLKDTCVPGCATSDVDAVHTKLVIADVGLAVGVVSLAAATFFALHGSSAAPARSWEVRVAPRLGEGKGGHATVGGAGGEVVVRF
jgi:hypothetical protein